MTLIGIAMTSSSQRPSRQTYSREQEKIKSPLWLYHPIDARLLYVGLCVNKRNSIEIYHLEKLMKRHRLRPVILSASFLPLTAGFSQVVFQYDKKSSRRCRVLAGKRNLALTFHLSRTF